MLEAHRKIVLHHERMMYLVVTLSFLAVAANGIGIVKPSFLRLACLQAGCFIDGNQDVRHGTPQSGIQAYLSP